MLVTKGERMRKLCDKNCETCELDECVMKHPPFDWSASEKQRTEISKEQRRNYVKRKKRVVCCFWSLQRVSVSRSYAKQVLP